MLKIPSYDPTAPVIVVDIGNTTTALATWRNEQIKTPLCVPTDQPRAFEEAFTAHRDTAPKRRPAAVVVASVVPQALDRVQRVVSDELDRDALVIGDAIPLPMDVEVTEPYAIGMDRVCGAFAAWTMIQQACTVISFGTCVTVDIVDDEGSLLGGAILPGLRLQFQAMREHTAVLPDVSPGVPELPYGRNTIEAMQTGVVRGLAGAVRGIVEGYASHLNCWPQLVATGGDIALLRPHCDFIDTFVEHLALRGVGLAFSKHLADIGV